MQTSKTISEQLHTQYEIETDFESLIEWLMHSTDCAAIYVYDEDVQHFGYFAKSSHGPDFNALLATQRAGYDIMATGKRHRDEFMKATVFNYRHATHPPEATTYPADKTVAFFEAKSRDHYRDYYNGER